MKKQKAFLLAASTALMNLRLVCLGAGGSVDIEGITRTNQHTILLQSAARIPLTEPITLPEAVQVFTNATFRVRSGKERVIKEGQIIRPDGTLLNADGTLVPIIDHLAMKAGKVHVVRDGEDTALSQRMTLPGGKTLSPDGTLVRSDGRRARLLDGECLRLDGTRLPSLDTISLRSGKVVVQKDGSLLTLQPLQIMGMSDGTRVNANGTVTRPGGKVIRLAEGQVLVIPGTALPPL